MFILIERQNHVTLEELKKDVPEVFSSSEYMHGFCDGYLFKKYMIVSDEQFALLWNNFSTRRDKYWALPAFISPPE